MSDSIDDLSESDTSLIDEYLEYRTNTNEERAASKVTPAVSRTGRFQKSTGFHPTSVSTSSLRSSPSMVLLEIPRNQRNEQLTENLYKELKRKIMKLTGINFHLQLENQELKGSNENLKESLERALKANNLLRSDLKNKENEIRKLKNDINQLENVHRIKIEKKNRTKSRMISSPVFSDLDDDGFDDQSDIGRGSSEHLSNLEDDGSSLLFHATIPFMSPSSRMQFQSRNANRFLRRTQNVTNFAEEEIEAPRPISQAANRFMDAILGIPKRSSSVIALDPEMKDIIARRQWDDLRNFNLTKLRQKYN